MAYSYDSPAGEDESEEQTPSDPPHYAYEEYLERLAQQAVPLTPVQQQAALQAQVAEREDLESSRGLDEPDPHADGRY